jgi:hypothetical protein
MLAHAMYISIIIIFEPFMDQGGGTLLVNNLLRQGQFAMAKCHEKYFCES